MHLTELRNAAFAVALLLFSAIEASAAESVIKSFNCDSTNGVISRDGVSVESDLGKSALKLSCPEGKSVTFRLFEIDGLNVDNARLLYQAKIKSENVGGKAYLEMWCRVKGKGEFFSRGMDQTLHGTNNWTSQEIPFVLKKGQHADLVKLNVVIEGGGTVTIDDAQLVKATK